jgi:hypothetical protein
MLHSYFFLNTTKNNFFISHLSFILLSEIPIQRSFVTIVFNPGHNGTAGLSLFPHPDKTREHRVHSKLQGT